MAFPKLAGCVCVAYRIGATPTGRNRGRSRQGQSRERVDRRWRVYEPYFGLRYPLPLGWKAGSQPPRPSYAGYYVLSTPSAPQGTKATILIAAQFTFFAIPPIADAGAMLLGFARSVSGGQSSPAEPEAVTITGLAFVRVDLPGTPLLRIVLATDIRCHVVIFTFIGAEPDRLKKLAATPTTFRSCSVAPICLKGYVTAQTIQRRVEPVSAGPRFVTIAVRMIIGADGRVEHVHVIRAFPEQHITIEDALAQWRFAPYLPSRRPPEIEASPTFEFKPPERSPRPSRGLDIDLSCVDGGNSNKYGRNLCEIIACFFRTWTGHIGL